MTKKYCRDCGTNTQHKPYRTGLFKHDSERVKTCKKCGHLRTVSERQIPEGEIIHVPTQTKKKNMEDEKE